MYTKVPEMVHTMPITSLFVGCINKLKCLFSMALISNLAKMSKLVEFNANSIRATCNIIFVKYFLKTDQVQKPEFFPKKIKILAYLYITIQHCKLRRTVGEVR